MLDISEEDVPEEDMPEEDVPEGDVPEEDIDSDDIGEVDIGAEDEFIGAAELRELTAELAAEPAAEVADEAVVAVDPQAARVRARPAPATRARARLVNMMSPWDVADPDLRFRRDDARPAAALQSGESLSSSRFR